MNALELTAADFRREPRDDLCITPLFRLARETALPTGKLTAQFLEYDKRFNQPEIPAWFRRARSVIVNPVILPLLVHLEKAEPGRVSRVVGSVRRKFIVHMGLFVRRHPTLAALADVGYYGRSAEPQTFQDKETGEWSLTGIKLTKGVGADYCYPPYTPEIGGTLIPGDWQR